jgi:hypothetical protein
MTFKYSCKNNNKAIISISYFQFSEQNGYNFSDTTRNKCAHCVRIGESGADTRSAKVRLRTSERAPEGSKRARASYGERERWPGAQRSGATVWWWVLSERAETGLAFASA